MSDLEIPDRAWTTASKIIGSMMVPNNAVIALVKIAVAAELRRMARECPYSETSFNCNNRADELDPPERTD